MKRIATKLLYLLQAIFLKNDRTCPYCSKSDFDIVFKKMGIVDICCCRNCGLYWTNPIFHFPKFYNLLYKAEGVTTYFAEDEELEEMLRTSFSNTGKHYIPLIQWFKKQTAGRRFLDFGSSWGYVVYQAKQQGFRAIGVEVAKKRREFGINRLGIDIRSSINDLIASGEKFDVIFTAHTLEHLGYEIKEIFSQFYNLLAHNGILLIEVPYLDFKRGKSVFTLMGALHPIGFTEKFFIANLPKHGFEISAHLGHKDIVPNFRNGNLVIFGKKR